METYDSIAKDLVQNVANGGNNGLTTGLIE